MASATGLRRATHADGEDVVHHISHLSLKGEFVVLTRRNIRLTTRLTPAPGPCNTTSRAI
jgi:hypothetical protein